MLTLLALAAAAAHPAPAAAPAQVNALRCMMIAGVAAQSNDAEVAQAGKYASLYWMGRINGETPNANLAQQLAATAKAMDGTDIQAEANRCGDEMKARGQQMQDAGKVLQEQTAPAK